MIDIVTYFEEKAESLGIVFDYGTKSMNNLLGSDNITGEVFLLLSSPTKWKRDPSNYGALGKQTINSSFLFVVKSNFDNVIYNQRGSESDKGKYKKNVLPLIDKLDDFKKLLDCSLFTVEFWEAIDAYNLLDTNTDGLVVTFILKET